MAVLVVGSGADIRATITKILDYFSGTIDPARGFFLKPNIVFPVRDTSGEITRIRVVKTLIEALRNSYPGTDIVIGEGTAAGSIPEENFRISGFADLAREMNVPLVDLHEADRVPVSWYYGTIDLPRMSFDRTYINLPMLKSSSAAGISGALKNQKGLIPASMKKQFHRMGLDEPLAHLNAVIRPSLSIMDCSTFLGKAVFLAGDNCGEVDEVACRALGIDEPNHLKLSRQLHVFQSGFRVDGDTPRASVMPRAFLKRRFKSMGGLRLWSNPRACSMCRYLFRDLQRMPASLREVMTGIRLLPHFIRGAEIIMGSNPSFVRERETVICVGECTRAIAEENGYIHVPGCPPARRQLVNALRGNVKKQRGGRGPDDT